MKRALLYLLITCSQLLSHGFAQNSSHSQHSHQYTIFLDAQYRSDDIYPSGFAGTHGYELHGDKESLEVKHFGLFYSTKYNQLYGATIELNRHIGSNDTVDEIVEMAFLSYGKKEFDVRLGRVEYGVSKIEQKRYGYGFSQMPIALDTFMSGSYYGDGISMRSNIKEFSFGADVLSDAYTKYGRFTLFADYTKKIQHAELNLFAYTQLQPKVSNKISDQNIHSHSNGCDDLLTNELCFDGSRTIYALGIEIDAEEFEILGEFIYNSEQGEIVSSLQKVKLDANQYSSYLQLIVPIGSFSIGYRYEYFWLNNSYTGKGSSDISSQIFSDSSSKYSSLGTAMLSYRHANTHTLRVEYRDNQTDSTISLQYLFTFNSSFTSN